MWILQLSPRSSYGADDLAGHDDAGSAPACLMLRDCDCGHSIRLNILSGCSQIGISDAIIMQNGFFAVIC
jgi:hypothetical protein